MSNNLKYRPDIDGLRAIAVLSVILFHMNPNWLPGGFLGVDIFFVISGFLITKIIHRQITQGIFCFSEFYTRRMKRILPAFFTVVLSCLVVGYFLLLPSDYTLLGKTAFTTIFAISNMYFARISGGYFQANDTYPLLHTWSLAVEEQYYFIWPIILLALLKFGVKQRTLMYSLGIVTLISFIGATAIAVSDTFLTTWNYYMLPSRAGELLIGSILAILLNNGYKLRDSNKWGAIGALLISLSFVLVNGESVFPGVNAFWACLGVALVIYSNPNNVVNKALSIKPLTYVGLISYSLYLWHWPVLAFMRYVNPNNQVEHSLSDPQLLFAGSLTWLLAHLTYKLVECRTRSVKTLFNKTFSFYLVVPSLAILVIFSTIFISKGFPSRFGDAVLDQIIHSTKENCLPSKDGSCILNTGINDVNIAVVGDSHGEALESFFKLLGQKNGLSIEDFASPSCSPARPLNLIGKVQARDECRNSRSQFKNKVSTTDAVFLVGRWENNFLSTYDNTIKGAIGFVHNYSQKLKNEIINLKSQGVTKIILVNQVPKYKQDMKKFLLPFSGTNYEVDMLYDEANRYVSELAKETDVFLVDFTPIFCKADQCSPFNNEGEVLYRDDDHLSIYGARWLFSEYKETPNYKQLLNYLNS